MSFANSEVLTALGGWFRPLIGRDPYNKKSVEDSQKAALKAVGALDDHFLVNTYLVGERLTLADLFAAGIISRGFQYFFDKEWRSNNPNVTRWFETVTNQSIYSDVAEKLDFIEKAIPNQPPKKEAAPKAEKPKEAPKPKAAAKDDDEEEAAPAPKPKHPLEALGRPTFAIDDLKRKYSNEETREVALPWFWENVNFDEYSLWRMDYKYNDELTMTFMTSNLIGMFGSSRTAISLLIRIYRWFLHSSRGFPQVHLRCRLCVRCQQRLCRPWCFPRPRPGGSPRLRCRP